MFVPYNTEKIGHAYPQKKHNFKRENQVILLMITEGRKWHYLPVKSLLTLFRGITSSHKENFYCLNCFHLYGTKNKLKKHEKVCDDHYYCYVEMPNKHNKILKYDHGEKPMKAPFIIYANLKPLLEKMHSCRNNPEKSYTEKN